MDPMGLICCFLVAWGGYVIAAHRHAQSTKLNQGVVLFAHIIPSLISCALIYIFMLRRGETVAQFAVGNEDSMDLWSFWVEMWPNTVLVMGSCCLAYIAWAICCAVFARLRRWLPIAAGGSAASFLGLVAVFAAIPMA